MRNEKKHSRTQPENADNIYMRQREKKTKKCSDSPCTTQTNNLKYSMQNNNTLTKKGESTMNFDNGIFRTVPHDTIDGVVWVVRISDGEQITFCRTQADVDFCIAELMKQRLAR